MNPWTEAAIEEFFHEPEPTISDEDKLELIRQQEEMDRKRRIVLAWFVKAEEDE